ncbi:MAG: hypothetical protein Ct9H300mP32_5190 [Verrucomicrobiota bacterium]|nr:MAG: hypothetical protein Ct9H300mP32_5190 [Verrucomicrobiota bacterium]
MVVLPSTYCMRNRLQTAWLIGVLLLAGCSPGGDSVTVYTSQDQVYAEPILQRFEQETGIRVRAVYDSEAVKTVGLVNRLIAEKNHPRWICFGITRSFARTQIAARGVLAADVPNESFGCARGNGFGTRTRLGARGCRRVSQR